MRLRLEAARASDPLARAFATFEVACTLIGVRFWQTHCSGYIEDAVGAANTLETRKSHVSFHVSGFIARLLMVKGVSHGGLVLAVAPPDTDGAAAHPARARGQLSCYVNTSCCASKGALACVSTDNAWRQPIQNSTTTGNQSSSLLPLGH